MTPPVPDPLPPLALNAWLRWDVVRRIVAERDPARVLEMGPGSATVSARLARMSVEYTGVEPDAVNRAIARPRLPAGARLVADLEAVGDERFDLVCAFEVLEHLDDDRAHLRSWVERTEVGGSVVLSVPAHHHRFGHHDSWAGHLRRYDRPELESLAAAAGLEPVEVHSYGGTIGYPLEWARDRLARRHLDHMAHSTGADQDRTATSARTRQPPPSLGPLTQAVTLPFRLLQRPLGRTGHGTGWVLDGRRQR